MRNVTDVPGADLQDAWTNSLDIIKRYGHTFMDKAKGFILNNFDIVCSQDEILEISYEEMDEYLSNYVDLKVDSDGVLFWLVMAWYKSDKENRAQYIPHLMNRINFDAMTREEQNDILRSENILECPALSCIRGKISGRNGQREVVREADVLSLDVYGKNDYDNKIKYGVKPQPLLLSDPRLKKNGEPDMRFKVNRAALLP